MEKQAKQTPEAIFDAYEKGKNYKSGLGKHGLFEQAKINERFFVGDQWYGADCGNDRPLVRHNIVKRIGEYKMSNIGAAPVSVNYTAEGVPNTVGLQKQQAQLRQRMAQGSMDAPGAAGSMGVMGFDGPVDREETGLLTTALSDYFSVTAERLKWDRLTEQALRNAYVSGTGLIYTYWDPQVKTGLYADETGTQPILGDIACEVLDVENVVFGDPNCDDVQAQPYILIAQRKSVEELRREARRFGRPRADIEQIRPDRDCSYQSGDRGMQEPEDSKKATVITKLYKEYNSDGTDYTVKAVRVVGGAVIRPVWDLMVRLYPLAVFPWERRRGSIYGESEITYLVPNQIAINRMLTACVWSVMLTGMPIMAVNKNLIPDPVTNAPGQVLEFTGAADDLQGALTYFNPPQFTNIYQSMISSMIADTLTQSGANDAALGDIRPDNTSAIIAVREAATMPLQPFKQRFYQFCEDIARIWAEFWVMLYGRRSLKMEDENGVWYLPFDGQRYKDLVLSVRVDVGASTLWSEAQSIQTLDNLLAAGLIDPVQYLERMPKGIIPDLTGLISSKQQELEQQQAMQQAAMQQQAMQQAAGASGGEVQAPAADPAQAAMQQPGPAPGQPETGTEQTAVQALLAQLSPEEQALFNSLPAEEQAAMLQNAMGA